MLFVSLLTSWCSEQGLDLVGFSLRCAGENPLSFKCFQKKRERKKKQLSFELSLYWIVFTPAIALSFYVWQLSPPMQEQKLWDMTLLLQAAG